MQISVIIPVSKPTWFRYSLASLLSQPSPVPEHEIIIVDDCDGKARAVLEEFKELLPGKNVQYILNTGGHNRSTVRNLGIERAGGHVILFLDDDMVVAPGFFDAHLYYHQNDFDIVINGDNYRALTLWYEGWFETLSDFDRGRVELNGGETLRAHIHRAPPTKQPVPLFTVQDVRSNFAGIWQLAYIRYNYLRENYDEALNGVYIPWYSGGAGNMSVNRAAVQAVNGFDQNFRGWGLEDIEFEYRLHQAGAKFAFGKRIVAFHQLHPRNWGEISQSNLANFRYFCEKHNSPIVDLFYYFRMKKDFALQDFKAYNDMGWRAAFGQLTGDELALAEQARSTLLGSEKIDIKARGF